MTDNLIDALEVASPRFFTRSVLTFRVPTTLYHTLQITHGFRGCPHPRLQMVDCQSASQCALRGSCTWFKTRCSLASTLLRTIRCTLLRGRKSTAARCYFVSYRRQSTPSIVKSRLRPAPFSGGHVSLVLLASCSACTRKASSLISPAPRHLAWHSPRPHRGSSAAEPIPLFLFYYYGVSFQPCANDACIPWQNYQDSLTYSRKPIELARLLRDNLISAISAPNQSSPPGFKLMVHGLLLGIGKRVGRHN